MIKCGQYLQERLDSRSLFVYIYALIKTHMQLLTPSGGLIVWTFLILLILLLPILAVISLLRSEYRDSTTKLIWLIVILFVPFAGSVLYFIIGRRQKLKAG